MLLCVSASHQTAPFEVLERLSGHTAPLAPAIAEHPSVAGAVVVSTCNRVEAYVDTASPDAAVAAARVALSEATGVPLAELHDSQIVTQGKQTVEHLFAVASGLESVVVGEGEIGGQVRRSLDEARKQGTTTSELERLFQRATETQKTVKNTTALGRAGRSLVRLALELADSRIVDWSELDVLLVGTGAYAAATLAALRDRGVRDVTVYSPSSRRQFATKHGLTQVFGEEDFAYAAAGADMVVTCTSREEPVLSAQTLRDGDYSGSSFVIDLGLPRNVHPDVATVPGVTLLDLETIRVHAPLEELQATDAAREIVRDATAKFVGETREQSAQPAVVALRKHVFSVLERELERGGSDEVAEALRHFTGMLLHTPTVRAKDAAGSGDAESVFAAVETLFGIDARPAAAAAPAECPVHKLA
ncbi:glutamyl-tRNA reductase [Microbacterium sorbitolivorans]|uniref:Glutamyl-tRNA reductase n=1 Tax=Microbacterium sorbitolivorans TaxID=1867410 RepID=A0A367Y2Q6_9MICO|nr:glutamyl-tRNA reductase [Microbacterium sorbitolivorans]RCK59909.1 glutamyl-tRNA reductase [Microbacterium sorbitolivorans]GGF41076.1 glutamyl-tRNA reductase [Microbacterium sorbitolivorans]